MSDDFDENQGMPISHAEANRLADERERVRAAREWWAMESKLDKGPPVMVSNEMAEKYGAKDVNWHYFKVIEYSAVGKLRARVEAAEESAQFYRREWESACERAEYTREIELERDSWKAECEALRHSPLNSDEADEIRAKREK